MIDHIGVSISDPVRSRRFYEQALAPLGYKVIMEMPVEFTGGLVVLGLGVPPKPDFWLHQGTPQKPHVHVAFRADEPGGGRRLLSGGDGGGRHRQRATRACGRTTTRTTTARSCSTPTGTTSRRAATCRRRRPAGSVLAVAGLILRFRLHFLLVDLDLQIVEGAVGLPSSSSSSSLTSGTGLGRTIASSVSSSNRS